MQFAISRSKNTRQSRNNTRPFYNPAYIGPRKDVLELLLPDAKCILDVGCSTGVLGAAIKQERNAVVFGIEISSDMALSASQRLEQVFVGDAEDVFASGQLGCLQFDTIIFADSLEHFVNPWKVLDTAIKYLKPNGTIIASIPNIRHWNTFYHLLIKKEWPYRDRGIHDRTHLRQFGQRNVEELFAGAGMTIEKWIYNYRIVERPHPINHYSKFCSIPGLRNLLIYQFLVRARQRDSLTTSLYGQ